MPVLTIDLLTKTYFGAIWSRDLDLVFLSMSDHSRSIDKSRYCQGEHSKLVLDSLELISVPVIEVTELSSTI